MCKVKSNKQYNSLVQVMQHFSSEDVCLQHLEGMRWPDSAPFCPKCECDKLYRVENGKRYKCSGCKHKFSAKVGTIFEGSNIGLQKWFVAIYLCTAHKKGVSSCQLARDLDITQKSAWFMLHRIRTAFVEQSPELVTDKVDSDGELIQSVVELDEKFVGGKEKWKHQDKRTKGTQGRSSKKKTPVLGMVERGGKVLAKVVPDTKGRTILPIIREAIPAGAIVMTDEYRPYKSLYKDYDHNYITHGAGQYVQGMVHTNNIEGFWSQLGRGITGIFHQVSPKHLQRYCDAYAFRYNTRKTSEADRFDVCLLQSVGRRLKYSTLIANN